MENQEDIDVKNDIVLNNKNKRFDFSKLFLGLAITCVVVTILAMLSTIITPLLYIFAIVICLLAVILITIFTLGMIYTKPDNIASKLWGFLKNLLTSKDSLANISEYCYEVSKYISIAGIVFSLITLALSLKVAKKRLFKIILLSIFIILFVVNLILRFV